MKIPKDNLRENRKLDMSDIMNYKFELIEDAIEIEGIEKLVTGYSESGADTDIINYINDKIVPSIKQLNKEIKSIKEK